MQSISKAIFSVYFRLKLSPGFIEPIEGGDFAVDRPLGGGSVIQPIERNGDILLLGGDLVHFLHICHFFFVEGSEQAFMISVADNTDIVTYNVGDNVNITCEDSDGSVVNIISISK